MVSCDTPRALRPYCPYHFKNSVHISVTIYDDRNTDRVYFPAGLFFSQMQTYVSRSKNFEQGSRRSSSPLNALIVQLLLAPERADCAQVSPRTTFLPKYTSPIFAEVLVLQLPGELPCRCRESPAGAEAHRGVSHRTKPQAKPSAKPSAKPALHSDVQIEDYCHLTCTFWKKESVQNPFFSHLLRKKIFLCPGPTRPP